MGGVDLTYEDLLIVRYKENGRDAEGMDCYGLVLECCNRAGTPLVDVVYGNDAENLPEYIRAMNVAEIPYPVKGAVLQCTFEGELHIGYLIDKKTCLHMTYSGVRVTPIAALKNKRYFEVIA